MLAKDSTIEQVSLHHKRGQRATDYGRAADFFLNCGCRGNKRLLVWGFQDDTPQGAEATRGFRLSHGLVFRWGGPLECGVCRRFRSINPKRRSTPQSKRCPRRLRACHPKTRNDRSGLAERRDPTLSANMDFSFGRKSFSEPFSSIKEMPAPKVR